MLCSALARGNNGQRSSVPCLLRPAGFAARLARLHPAPLGPIILLKLSFDSGVLSSSVALSSFSLNHRAGRAGAYYNMGFFRMAIIHVQPSLEMCHVFVCLLYYLLGMCIVPDPLKWVGFVSEREIGIDP